MRKDPEYLIFSFVTCASSPFTVQKISKILEKNSCYLSYDDIKTILKEYPFITYLGNDTYIPQTYIEHAIFSILPTKKEVDEGYLIVGHRTMPYTNTSILPTNLKFYFQRKKIKYLKKKLLIQEIKDHYFLFGDDMMMQIIYEDDANANQEANSIYDPDCITSTVSVLDMADFYKKNKFRYGDRIILTNKNFFEGEVNIAAMQDTRKNPFETTHAENFRQLWFDTMEKTLIENQKTRGPQTSIHDQLFLAVLQNTRFLYTPYTFSFEELLHNSKKLEVKIFGVSNRIWEKNSEIVAIRYWYDPFYLSNSIVTEQESCGICNLIRIPIDQGIVKAFVYDNIFYEEKDVGSILKKLVPDFITYAQDDYTKSLLLLEKLRSKELEKYNRFADYSVAEIRHECLILYCKIIELLHEIRLSNVNPETMKQQPLLMILYIVEHLTSTICIFLSYDNYSQELDHISDSLTGMQFSYEENVQLIMEELNSRHNNFAVHTCLEKN